MHGLAGPAAALRVGDQAPALRVGDRADCLMRGTVVITGWTDARISWPRCRRPVGKSHPSLLLDSELARAVRTAAAAAACAIRHRVFTSNKVPNAWLSPLLDGASLLR
jgi:hypothetical protein